MKPKPHEFENENANAMITKEDWVEHPVVSVRVLAQTSQLDWTWCLTVSVQGSLQQQQNNHDRYTCYACQVRKSQKPKLILISVQKDLIPMHSIKSKLT